MKVWIARDGKTSDSRSGHLTIFDGKPVFDDVLEIFQSESECEVGTISKTEFPQIKNGECYQAEIILKEKV